MEQDETAEEKHQLTSEVLHLEWEEWQDTKRIIQVYGVGLVWYRKYQYSLIVLDACLSLFALFPIVAHIVEGSKPYSDLLIENNAVNSTQVATGVSPFASALFLMITASYSANTLKWVYFYLAMHLLCILLHPFCYLYYLSKNHASKNIQYEDPWDHNEFHLRSEKDWKASHIRSSSSAPGLRVRAMDEASSSIAATSPFHQQLRKAHRFTRIKVMRNFLSVFCFLLVLAVYGVCLWGLQLGIYNNYLNNASVEDQLSVHLWVSLLLSILQGCTDLVWMIVSELLRYIEIHETQDSFEKWQCVRLFLLRVFSINMFYAIRTWILTNEQQCSAGLLGVQHILIVMSYIFGDLLADYVWPLLYRSYRRWQGNYARDYETWYEFLLSEQYATVAYRHILLSCGASFIPGLSFIALIGNVIQLKSDQYRLSFLCRISHRLFSSYERFVQVLGIFTVLSFLLAFPKGILFLFLDSGSFFTCDMLSTN